MRKFVAFIMIMVMLLANSAFVFAQESADITVDYNIKTKLVNISGSAQKDSEITIVVLNPGASLDAIGTDKTQLQNFAKVKSGADGKFKYSFILHTDGINDSGEYTIKAKVNGGEFLNDATFFFSDNALCLRVINDTIDAGSTEVLTAALNNADYIQALNLGNFLPFKSLTTSEFSSFVFESVKAIEKLTQPIDTVSELQNVLKEKAVLMAYNKGLSNVVFDSDGAILYEDILNTSIMSDDEAISLYNDYQQLISESGKALIRESLLSKNIKTISDWHKEFMTNVVVSGLKYPATPGYGHVEKILSAANCAAVGLDVDEEIKGEIAAGIARAGGYKDISELQAIIDEAVAEEEEPKNFGGSGSGSGGGGGGFRGNLNVETTLTPLAFGHKFTDIKGYTWAEEAISKLYNEEIIDGISNDLFAPSKNVTREQIAKVVCLIGGFNTDKANNEFADVPADSWYAPYVTALKNNGVISGISETSFGSGLEVTRGDLVLMLYRAFGDKISRDGLTEKEFADKLPEYAKEAIEVMASAGVINGYSDGTFKADAPCTRAEMAVIIYNTCRAAKIFE